MKARSIALPTAALALMLVTACGSHSAATTTTAQAGKFEQTWTRGYGQTTCSQWLSTMDAHQTFVAAADMLVNARGTQSKTADLPSDDVINSFKREIDTACEPIGSMTITDAATG